MPASAVGGVSSWGMYMLASTVLVLLLSPQLSQVAALSRTSADWRNIDGARAVFESLRPGEVVLFAFAPNWSDPIRLQGHELSCSDGNGTLTAAVSWTLPDSTILPGKAYALSVALGQVVVNPV